FIWGFQVCFVLPLLLATLSFLTLALNWSEAQQPDQLSSTALLAVSILSALGAAYSLASGNLLWPLLLAAALYLRLGLRIVLSLAAAGAVSTALFFYHYVRPAGHANPIASLGEPLTILKYCATYFLSAWPYYDTRGKWIVWLAMPLLFFPVLRYFRKFR